MRRPSERGRKGEEGYKAAERRGAVRRPPDALAVPSRGKPCFDRLLRHRRSSQCCFPRPPSPFSLCRDPAASIGSSGEGQSGPLPPRTFPRTSPSVRPNLYSLPSVRSHRRALGNSVATTRLCLRSLDCRALAVHARKRCFFFSEPNFLLSFFGRESLDLLRLPIHLLSRCPVFFCWKRSQGVVVLIAKIMAVPLP